MLEPLFNALRRRTIGGIGDATDIADHTVGGVLDLYDLYAGRARRRRSRPPEQVGAASGPATSNTHDS